MIGGKTTFVQILILVYGYTVVDILQHMMGGSSFRLVCKLFLHYSVTKLLTLDLFLCLLVSYHAARLCTFLILYMCFFFWYNSDTVVVYFICGLTDIMQASYLVNCKLMLRFRYRKPTLRLTFRVTLIICNGTGQLYSRCVMRQRMPWSLKSNQIDFFFLFCDCEDTASYRMELNFPEFTIFCQFVLVFFDLIAVFV